MFKSATIELTFDSEELRTFTKMRVALYGDDGFVTSGDWKAADDISRALLKIYLGRSSGYWECRFNNGTNLIYLFDHDDPNFVSWLWRDVGNSVCDLLNVGPIPLMPGRKGVGQQVAPPMRLLYWETKAG